MNSQLFISHHLFVAAAGQEAQPHPESSDADPWRSGRPGADEATVVPIKLMDNSRPVASRRMRRLPVSGPAADS